MRTLLQINTVVNYGSTGKIVENIGQKVIDSGWKSYVAYGRKPRDSKSNLIYIGSAWSILWHYIQRHFFDRAGLASVKATKYLLSEIEKISPDIVHIHNLHGYYINIELLLTFLAKQHVPVVLTLHDCWCITGHCGHFTEIKCDKWKNLCMKCPQLRLEPLGLIKPDRSTKNYILKRNLFNSLENLTIVPVSYWLQDIIKQSFLCHKSINVIYNGIDLSQFKPKNNKAEVRLKYNIKSKYILIGVANVWDDRKGLNDFIQLSHMLSDDFSLVLVGLSKKQNKLFKSNVINIERTESVGELADLYSAADVYINLSVEETFGLTTVEAMACGTPVIVYNSTASPELVTDNTGFVVDAHDINSVYDKITICVNKGKPFYKETCRHYAMQHYDKNMQTQSYLQLYQKILDNYKKSI